MNKNALWQLTIARFREFYREPAAVFWVYGFPLFLAVLLGLAFRDRPVEKIAVDIISDGEMEQAEKLKERLTGDERLKITLNTSAEARNRLRTAKTSLVVVPSETGAAEYIFDPNRPECVLAKNAVDNRLLRSGPNPPALPAEVALDEPGGRYIDFLLPGLMGTNLMGGGLFGVGFLIVDMRVRKLLKRFLATPMKPRDFLMSILLSRLVFVLIEIVFLLAFGNLAFGVTVRGSWFALSVFVLLSAISFAGLGLFIACRAKTIETVSGLMNAAMLPMYILSGVFFPSDRFPEAVQPLIKLLPLTATNDGLRAIINDGAGFGSIVQPSLVLIAWAVICFALALKFFRWR
jgi:ABC-type multidrug transport system permease subunit